MSYIRIAIVLIGLLGVQGPARADVPVADQMTANVIGCYKAGSDTVEKMYACSGLWVTPRVLTLCFLDSGCPVVPDTLSASAIEAALGADQLRTKLVIDMKSVLAMPDRKMIDECRTTTSDETSFVACVAPKMVPKGVSDLAACSSLSDVERALCLSKSSKDLTDLITCVSLKGMNPDAVLQCSTGEASTKVQQVTSCVNVAVDSLGKVGCLIGGGDPAQRELADCLTKSGNDPMAGVACLGKLDPQVAAKVAELKCAVGAVDSAGLAACVAGSLGGDVGKVAACAAGGKENLAECLFGDKPEYQAATQLAACAQGGEMLPL